MSILSFKLSDIDNIRSANPFAQCFVMSREMVGRWFASRFVITRRTRIRNVSIRRWDKAGCEYRVHGSTWKRLQSWPPLAFYYVAPRGAPPYLLTGDWKVVTIQLATDPYISKYCAMFVTFVTCIISSLWKGREFFIQSSVSRLYDILPFYRCLRIWFRLFLLKKQTHKKSPLTRI